MSYKRYKIQKSLESLYPELPYHNIAHTQSFDYATCPSDEAFWAAVFHDIMYDPFASDNVEKSAQYFKNWYELYGPDARRVNTDKVISLIRSTQDHVKSFDASDEDMVWLHSNDLVCFRVNRKGTSIAENEKKIFQEYQFISLSFFKGKRLDVLNYYKKHPLVSVSKIDRIITYLDSWEPNYGIFCGSFNPFHKGHLDILQQAEKVFDKVIVAQGQNEDKQTADFSLDSVPALKYHEKVKYEGSLFSFLDWQKKEKKNLTLIRGLRNYHDLHDESGLFNFAKDYTDVPFAYFISKSENVHISSGAIRKLTTLGKDVSSYLP